MSRKLFVGNLPFSTSEGELQDLFEQAGAIESVRVMRDMATGRARGFAFVEMQTDEDAQAAIQRFNGTELGGRAIVVNEARPKPEFAGSGGGGEGTAGGVAEKRCVLPLFTRRPGGAVVGRCNTSPGCRRFMWPRSSRSSRFSECSQTDSGVRPCAAAMRLR